MEQDGNFFKGFAFALVLEVVVFVSAYGIYRIFAH